MLSSKSTSNEELYQSLQKDWRQEIQEMFNELKDKEQVCMRSFLLARNVRIRTNIDLFV